LEYFAFYNHQNLLLAYWSTDKKTSRHNSHNIITTVKHAIWLVNSRAGSGNPARGIKMPSRDFREIIKMSLFHCSYFIKQLPNGFPSRIAWSMHLGRCSTFGKHKNTLACVSSIFTLSESLATSLVHGSRNLAWKTFGILLLFYALPG
jgi:hypothetical protein